MRDETHVNPRPSWCLPAIGLLTIALMVPVGCSGGGGGGGALPTSVQFIVKNGAGFPVVAATVYLVPAGDIDDTPFDNSDVLSGASEDADEPLEDAIRLHGAGYIQGATDVNGAVTLAGVPQGRFFWFVMPDAADTEHLPGGSGCRISREAVTFLGTTVTVTVSGQPTPVSAYLGTSACLQCHTQYDSVKEHAHRLGFTVPGQVTPLQSTVRYPAFGENQSFFVSSATFNAGTKVYFSDFDSSRGFDKFKTSMTDPSPAETVYVVAYLWQDTADGKYKITLDNIINGADPNRTLIVEMVYGGAVFKQRNLVSIPGRNGRYPLLQWQENGDEARFDRTRKKFRDYHLDWYWDNATQTLKDPSPSNAFEGNCSACHFTGFTRYQDPVTLEWLSDAVDDQDGAFDIDGDGFNDEINVGCEVCHGPGASHVTWAANAANAGQEGRYIVCLSYLSPSREMQICGRCHDRVKGNGPVPNDEPLNAAGEMPPPGISRADYLASYTTRRAPASSSLWNDDLHSKSHHQQYTDLLKSGMHRNSHEIVTCSSCHDSHGYFPYIHHLNADPGDPNSPLCARCHQVDLATHTQAQTGSMHAGNQTTCVLCHMTKAAKTGSGTYGLLLGTPTGTSGDPALTYFRNDITSHLFMDIPKKSHSNVAGFLPGSAMPVPYTLSCGAPCHDATQLQFLDRVLNVPGLVSISGSPGGDDPWLVDPESGTPEEK